ncbi:MAG: hypothetical protein ACRDT1_15455, partial [Micromonosporaceae bacterium]
AGEMLPERAVMSTVLTPMFGSQAEAESTVVAYACSSGSSPATAIGFLFFDVVNPLKDLSAAPSSGPGCAPAGIVTD